MQPKSLALDQVVELALRNSMGIKQAELDVDRAREVADAAWEYHGYMLVKTWTGTDNLYKSYPGSDEHSWYKALSADRGWHIQQKTFEMTKDAISLNARRLYNDILKKQHGLGAAGAALEKAERDYRTVLALAAVGMSTNMQVYAASAGLQRAGSAAEQARADLEGAYRALNKLIGLEPEERPVLTTEPEFKAVAVESLDLAINRALSLDNNPYLWSKREGYELQRYVWSYTQPSEAGLIDRDKAWLSYEDARAETRNKIYELFDTMKTLEAAHASAQEGLALAREALRAAELRHWVGLATYTAVLEQKAALAQAEAAVLELRSTHASVKETFEKPWLAFLVPSTAFR
ncbi:MAG: TolC family protein [Bacillota bacterium]